LELQHDQHHAPSLPEALDLGPQQVILLEKSGGFTGRLSMFITQRLVFSAEVIGYLLQLLLLLFPALSEATLGFPVLRAASDLQYMKD
jgi:hypothetical protein